MKSLRTFFVLIFAVLFAFSLVACGEDAPDPNELTVTVEAYDYDNNPIVLGDVTFSMENPTVLAALEAMCIAREVSLEYDQSLGIVQKMGDAGPKSFTDEETGKKMSLSWAWKLNGEEASGFANETVIKSGDKIEYYQYAYVDEEEVIIDPEAEVEE